MRPHHGLSSKFVSFSSLEICRHITYVTKVVSFTGIPVKKLYQIQDAGRCILVSGSSGDCPAVVRRIYRASSTCAYLRFTTDRQHLTTRITSLPLISTLSFHLPAIPDRHAAPADGVASQHFGGSERGLSPAAAAAAAEEICRRRK